MSTDAPEPPPLIPLRKEGYFGGIELLAADARVASLFADEARRRSMLRLFGIPKTDKSGLVTLIALLAAAEAIRRRTENVHRPPNPTLPGVMLGMGLVKEAAYDIAGPWARETPLFGTLLALALMGGTVRLGLRTSTRGVRRLTHQAGSEFAHRYGHLVRPNRPRAGA
jgi:hypothetical protein